MKVPYHISALISNRIIWSTSKPNKHIIFKKKVTANGTKEKPIIFKRFDNQMKPWGSVVILGKNTKGSLFNHVVVSG